MKNSILITLIIFIISIINAYSKPLKVGFWDNPPLAYMENNEPKGLNVDIFKYIAKKHNIEYQFIYGSWSELYSDISNGKIDIFFPIGYAEYRLKNMDFSKCYIFENWGQIITLKDKNINSIYDLKGKTIAVQFNDIFLMAPDGLGNILDRLHINVKYYFVDTYPEAVDAVLNKGIDAALIGRNYTFSITNSQLKISNVIIKPIKSHFSYKKGLDNNIKEKIDNELKNLISNKNSHYYKRLRYFSEGYYLHNPILSFFEEYYIAVIVGIIILLLTTSLLIFISKNRLRKAFLQIQEDRKKLSIILNNLKEPIIVFNEENKIEFFNNGAKNTFNNLYLGKSIYECDHLLKDSKNKTLQFYDLLSLQALDDYYIIKNDSGSELVAEISITKIYNRSNTDFKYILSINDITSTVKNLEIQTKMEKMEMLGKIAAGIAHDFNNYLGAISNYLMAIKIKKELDKEIPKIENIVQKSKHLTKQLLTFAKGSNLEIKNIDICSLVKNASEFSLKGSMVSLNFNTENSEQICVNVDENYLTQVITNIVINAKQAMNDKGKIDINIGTIEINENNDFQLKKGEYVKISIKDSGPGIPDKIAKHIFEPFFSTKESGSGLGLSTAYSIIKQHNGYLTFKNLETGCVFEIYLPKADCTIHFLTDENSKFSGDSFDILYMDDESDLRESLKMMLELLNHKVTVTANGEETLKAIENKNFDIIILDLTIRGGMDGKDTIKQLKDKGVDSFFVVTSGYSESEIITNYKDYGFDFFLPKPLSIKDLETIINTVKRKKSI